MRFIELASARHSIRAYRPDPVSDADLRRVLEAARMAPSACNIQPWTLIIVRDAPQRKALSEAYPRDWFAAAPIQIAVCVDERAAWHRRHDGMSYARVDAAILMDHLTLAATEAGLGTCWIAAFDPVIARRVLKLPEGIEPVVLTPLGWPSEHGRPQSRKAIEEMVRYDHW